MKFIILHLHGYCPLCGKLTCIYADYYRDEDSVKMQNGWECGNCKENFGDFTPIEIKCPQSETVLEKVVEK